MKREYWVLGAACGIATVAADQLTKQWALGTLSDGHTIPVLGRALSLRLLYNPGAAFSLGENATIVFTVVAALVVIILPIWVYRTTSRAWMAVIGVVWGGALGNLIDRLVRPPAIARGHVVDFIAYGDLFVGNVADIALVVGIAALVVLMLRGTPLTTADTSGTNQLTEGEANPEGSAAGATIKSDVDGDAGQRTAGPQGTDSGKTDEFDSAEPRQADSAAQTDEDDGRSSEPEVSKVRHE
ncbi:signal peptidase II [Actinobaculum sp. 313]|uniref:signal peptidase II n=1 Tax=Actinobaculum sp. 313 TaxID=2495645 RepID=UPI001F0BC930|nr:signal peptidase II [Actinobaculum sp. 313]